MVELILGVFGLAFLLAFLFAGRSGSPVSTAEIVRELAAIRIEQQRAASAILAAAGAVEDWVVFQRTGKWPQHQALSTSWIANCHPRQPEEIPPGAGAILTLHSDNYGDE